MPAVSTRSVFGSSHSISGLIAVEPQSARNRPGTDERSIPRDESDRLPDQAGFARCRAQESDVANRRIPCAKVLSVTAQRRQVCGAPGRGRHLP
jgi:hypothetical protein